MASTGNRNSPDGQPPPRNAKQRLASELWSLADLVRASATRREFRSRAYRRAVWSLDDLSPELSDSFDSLLTVAGIGPGVARLISQFREDGEIAEVKALASKVPAEGNRLRLLPRMTPARLRWLKAERGVDTVDDLIQVIDQQRLGELKGVGPDTARTWLDRLEALARPGQPPYVAYHWAHSLRSHIERHVGGSEVTVTGSVRRLDEWVEEVDLVSTRGLAVTGFLEQSAIVTGYSDLAGGARVETLGGPFNLHTPAPDGFVAAVFRTTGPPEHVDAILGASRGVEPQPWPETEAEIYRAAGRPFVPPPARSRDLDVPEDLIEVEHLRGDLHLHSDWSPDGRQTIEEIVQVARSRGLDFVGITDHAEGLRFGGLDEERIEQQRVEIQRVRARYPDIVILHGSELNIDREGNVDFDQAVLDRLDFGIAAVHSFFTLSRDEQTTRLLTAIANPRVNVIAHLTGRRIGIRPGIDLDLEQVLAAAAESRTALEVNGHLDRMDAGADVVRQAHSLGALFAANSDAHLTHELSNAAHSVAILQHGWVTRARVINAWTPEDLAVWARPGR